MAFQALTATTDRVPILTDTGINDFGIRLLTKRAMHAHNNSVKYPEHAKTRVSRVRGILSRPRYHCQPPLTSIVPVSIVSVSADPPSIATPNQKSRKRRLTIHFRRCRILGIPATNRHPLPSDLHHAFRSSPWFPISIMPSNLHHGSRSSPRLPIFTTPSDLHHESRSSSWFSISIPASGTHRMPHLPSPLPIAQHMSCTGRILTNRPVFPASPSLCPMDPFAIGRFFHSG